jgi:hypothetical protein
MRLLVFFGAFALTSCASLYPHQPWTSRDELIKTGQEHQLVPITVNDARNLIIGLYEVLSDAKKSRDLQALVGEEVTFYGTLIAVAGITADSRAARNSGGVLAGLAALLVGHYKPADQSLIFDKAAQRVDCLKEAMRPISPQVRNLFGADFGTGNDDVVAAYAEIPAQTIDFVDTISKDLNAALQSVVLSAPSKDELTTTMQGWKDSKNKAKPAVAPTVVAQGVLRSSLSVTDLDAQTRVHDEMQALLVAVRDFHTNGAACLVQHTQ